MAVNRPVVAPQWIGETSRYRGRCGIRASDDACWITANRIDAVGGMYLEPIDQGEVT